MGRKKKEEFEGFWWGVLFVLISFLAIVGAYHTFVAVYKVMDKAVVSEEELENYRYRCVCPSCPIYPSRTNIKEVL